MSLDLNLVPDGGVGWLDASGPESHIVLSTRVRLARNVVGKRFTIRADANERASVLHDVETAVKDIGQLEPASLIGLDALTPLERQLLYERHLVSRDIAGLGGQAVRSSTALVAGSDVGLMVNEEDHLRLQCFRSGFALWETYRELGQLDTSLGERLPFAFHNEFGYLTSCPTNAGTGMRASVLIHLPGLVLTKEISKVLQGLSQVGLTFRGLYGEGSEVVGNFFQISNQTTLGKSEEDLLAHLSDMVTKVLEYEERARQVLVRDARAIIADKVWRAYGLLRYARTVSFEEMMNLLSGVRLGVGVGLVSGVSTYALNKLMIFAQPA
ncbi:MAG: ATP--guanido phosphotransferase, partial [Gemmatimonadota bacterium]|nr:ATP--guanido phosphotransferase [Gemmatimonadota bacterium]